MEMTDNEKKIHQMYDASLASQNETLKSNYDAADADLDVKKEDVQKQTDSALRQAAVANRKTAVNNAELHNASGLSSGTRAAVQTALQNQHTGTMTAIRTAQQEADAEIERQRGVLSREYANAIREAQRQNDLERAQKLYAEAAEAENITLNKQITAANLQAQGGNYGPLAEIYGLSGTDVMNLRMANGAYNGLTYEEVKTYMQDNGGVLPYSKNDFEKHALKNSDTGKLITDYEQYLLLHAMGKVLV